MNTNKKISPHPKSFNPYLSKKNYQPSPPPAAKNSLKNNTPTTPLKKIQPPKSPRSHENYTCSLSTLKYFVYVGEIKKKNLQN